MTDNVSSEKRSKIMASIKSKDTKPELIIRKILWSHGKRYRIHDKTVPGTPDISNKTKKVAIFVDGCFWHGCDKCYKEPRTNTAYWKSKIDRNKERRREIIAKLSNEKWIILEFWEHQVIKESLKVEKEIVKYI